MGFNSGFKGLTLALALFSSYDHTFQVESVPWFFQLNLLRMLHAQPKRRLAIYHDNKEALIIENNNKSSTNVKPLLRIS